MEMRPLGATGIGVGLIGLGTVKFGRAEGVKYPKPFDLPDDDAVRRQLDLARELGVNLLDTAPAYGLAEERLGRLMDPRRDWVIVGKVGEEFAEGRSRFDFSASTLHASLGRSLDRLGTDYLDVLLLHSDGDDQAILDDPAVIAALRQMKAAGRVRAIGISSKTVAGGLLGVELLDVVMVTLNPGDKSQLPVIEAARGAGKGVLIKKALDSGHIGAGGAGAALGEVAAVPGVASIVVGTLNPDHLRANVAAVANA